MMRVCRWGWVLGVGFEETGGRRGMVLWEKKRKEKKRKEKKRDKATEEKQMNIYGLAAEWKGIVIYEEGFDRWLKGAVLNERLWRLQFRMRWGYWHRIKLAGFCTIITLDLGFGANGIGGALVHYSIGVLRIGPEEPA
jgi:hypothetical protein